MSARSEGKIHTSNDQPAASASFCATFWTHKKWQKPAIEDGNQNALLALFQTPAYTNEMETDKAFKILMDKTRFFQSFPENERLEILKCCTSLSAHDGKFIFQEGTQGDDFFILISGSVRIVKNGKTVDVLRAGECFGEMGALSGQERSATAEASGDLVLLVINEKKVEELRPETRAMFYKNILLIISDRLRERLEDHEH